MMSCTAAILMACFTAGPADEKPDFAKELKGVKEKFAESIRSAGGRTQAFTVASRQQRKDMEALAKKGDAAPAGSLTSADQAALAEVHSALGARDKAAALARAAVKSDPKNINAHELLIRNLAQSGKPGEAEMAFKAAPSLPERSKNSLQMTLAQAYAGEKDLANSSRLYVSYLDAIRPGALKEGRESLMYARSCAMYVRTMGEARRAEALKRLDGDVAAFAKVASTKPEWKQPLTDLRMLKVGLLMNENKKAEAMAIIASEKKDAEADSKPASAIARRIALAMAETEHGDDAAVEAAVKDYTAFAGELIARDAKNAVPALRGFTSLASNLVYDKPKLANSAFVAGKQAMEAAKKKGGADAAIAQVESGFKNLDLTIASAMKRFDLIGKPAKAWKPEAWVNGSPLSGDSLKGKVVLLDFWAVWCGPCIMTFPHLREWNEKYEKNGLVVLGFTKYYKFGWDEASNKPKAQQDLSQADERAATEKFAKHHKLGHRLVYFPNNDVSEEYGVTGIPQAVLIDRNGVVRMIKVGAGDKNAHDLEAMIQKLLAETPAPATGG